MHGADFTTANNLFAFGAFFRSRTWDGDEAATSDEKQELG